MEEWRFLTNHARTMLFIAGDPDVRLRDLAVDLGVTERTAFGLVVDLTDAGYLLREKTGRRNRYHIQSQQPLRDWARRVCTIGELVNLFIVPAKRPGPRADPPATQPPDPLENPTPAALTPQGLPRRRKPGTSE